MDSSDATEKKNVTKKQLEFVMSFFLQESLLEIDEEEDTTDFGQAFFASHSQQQTEEHQAPQPQSLTAKITHSTPWWPSSLIPSRQSQHNKDIKLIGRDGGVQIGRYFIISGYHTVPNLHFMSKNSTLISQEKLSNCFG